MPEVLGEIFSHLENKGDIYHAALVCSAWCGVALDQLWKEMSSIAPLLDLLGTANEFVDHTVSDIVDEVPSAMQVMCRHL